MVQRALIGSGSLAMLLAIAGLAGAEATECSRYWDTCTTFDGRGMEYSYLSYYLPELDVGSTKVAAMGVGLGAGYRVGRLTTGAEYSAAFGSALDETPATVHRIGLVARYLRNGRPRSDVRLRGLYLEAGIGREFVSLEDGGFSRSDVVLGVGGQTTIAIEDNYVAMFVGMRSMITTTPDDKHGDGRLTSAFLVTFGGTFHLELR